MDGGIDWLADRDSGNSGVASWVHDGPGLCIMMELLRSCLRRRNSREAYAMAEALYIGMGCCDGIIDIEWWEWDK